MLLFRISIVLLIFCGGDAFAHFRWKSQQMKTSAESMDIDWNKNFTIEFDGVTMDELRAPQFRRPCECTNFNCGCCAGMNILPMNFKRLFCTNLTYDPYEFQVGANIMMNDNVIYSNMFSGKNPEPMCVPVGSTPITMCMKFFNIFTPGRNIHMCMDMEAKVRDKPYLILHFDCMRMGQDGFAILKPEQNGGEVGTGAAGGGGAGGGGLFGTGILSNRPGATTTTTTTEDPSIDVDQAHPDTFDPVTEIKYTRKPTKKPKFIDSY